MYETKYRTATIMEEDALNKPTAAGAMLSAHQIIFYSNILLVQEKTRSHPSLSILLSFF